MNLVMKIVEWWMMQKGRLNIIYEVYILLEFPLFFKYKKFSYFKKIYILYKNFMSTWVIIVEGGVSSHIRNNIDFH